MEGFETGATVFGVDPTPEFLIQSVRSYSWEASFKSLCWIAAKVTQYGTESEEVRRLTVDPLGRLSGNASAASIVDHARAAVAARRNTMLIAHEQALSFAQHLVLLEGGDGGETPGDPEVSLWLACAGSFLSRWQSEDVQAAETEELIATISHGLRFNNKSDSARNLVRSSMLFARRPREGELSNEVAWKALASEAFGGPYEEFFEGVLGPLYLLSHMWGDESRGSKLPMIDIKTFRDVTRLPEERFVAMLDLLSADRATHRDTVRKRLRDGMPHAPTSLLYQPFVRLTGIYIAASAWAIQHQVRFAPWAQLMMAARKTSKKKSPDVWFRGFGQQVEAWCREVADAARASPFCKVRFQMPTTPGGQDEVEDVVLIEGKAIILFSVKSRVMEAKAAREAISPETTMQWYKDYFFEERGDDLRGGAVRQLHNRIRMIREGRFTSQGVSASARILPVIVTYDSLGESDLLYRWIASQCETRGLLQGTDIGPLTLARVDEFEDLMARAADGKSVVELLRRREGPDKDRRLDQIISENGLPKRRKRLPFFAAAFTDLSERIRMRLKMPELASSRSEVPGR